MNNKKISIDELKKIQIGILDYIDNFCRKNNINYWIDTGTLLGAVRHKGYIPWDDDIDIGMLRDDYEKFIKLFNKDNKTQYKFHCYEIDKNWYFPYGKVLDENTIMYEPDEETGIKTAVFVDVFIYDNIINDEKIIKKMYKKRDLYTKLSNLQNNKHFVSLNKQKYNFIRYPFYLLMQLFPKRYFVKKNIKNSKKYINSNTNYVGNLTSVTKMICSKDVFKSFVDLEFEGKKYKAPIGYEEWLKAFYGDYMKLPPKEKQVSHHRFVAYYK